MGGSRGADPLKNLKAIGFLSNIGLDPLKNNKAIKPAFSVGHHRLRQRFAVGVDDGPLIVWYLDSSLPSPTKKTLSELDPSDKTFWIRAYRSCCIC